jgi:hypothetical protein
MEASVPSWDIVLVTFGSRIIDSKHAVAWKEMLRVKCNKLILWVNKAWFGELCHKNISNLHRRRVMEWAFT